MNPLAPTPKNPGSIAIHAASRQRKKNPQTPKHELTPAILSFEGTHPFDQARKFLNQHHVSDVLGIINPKLTNLVLDALNPTLLSVMDAYFEKPFDVINPNNGFNFGIKTSGDLFLKKFLEKCSEGVEVKGKIVPIHFKLFDTIGSITKYAFNIDSLKNSCRQFIKLAYEDKNLPITDKEIDDHVETLFKIPHFAQLVKQRLTSQVPDGDSRLYFSVEYPAESVFAIFKALRAKIIDVLSEGIPKITDNAVKLSMINRIIEINPDDNWKWLTCETPDFEKIAIRHLAMQKLSIVCEPGKQLLIFSLGNLEGHRLEFTIVNKITITELAPSLIISSNKYLPGAEDLERKVKGHNKEQCLLNLMLGQVTPSQTPNSEEFSTKLICSYTQNSICPLDQVEDRSIAEVLKAAKTTDHHIIRKLNKEGVRPIQYLPMFISSIMNKAIRSHFLPFPEAAVACMFNTLIIYENHLTPQNLGLVATQLKRNFVSQKKIKYESLTLFQAIGYLLAENKYLNQKLAFIKLCILGFAQSEQLPSAKIYIELRNNKKRPCLVTKISVDEETSYTLVTGLTNPLNLLPLAREFLQSNLSEETQNCVKTLISYFLPIYKGAASSHMLNEAQKLSMKEKEAFSAITERLYHSSNLECLFNSFLFFAFQTLISEPCDQHSMTICLPILLIHYPEFSSLLLSNYQSINTKHIDIGFLTSNMSEQQLTQHIFELLLSENDSYIHSVTIWDNNLSVNPNIKRITKTLYAEKLIFRTCKYNPSKCLKIFLDCMTDDLLSESREVELLGNIMNSWNGVQDKRADIPVLESIFSKLKILEILGIKQAFASKLLELFKLIPQEYITPVMSKVRCIIIDIEKKHQHGLSLHSTQAQIKSQTPPPAPIQLKAAPKQKQKAIALQPVKVPQEEKVEQGPTQNQVIEKKIADIIALIGKNNSQVVVGVEDLVVNYKISVVRFNELFRQFINYCIKHKDFASLKSCFNNLEIYNRIVKYKEQFYSWIFETFTLVLAQPDKIDKGIFNIFEKVITEIDTSNGPQNEEVALRLVNFVCEITDKLYMHASKVIPATFSRTLSEKTIYLFSVIKKKGTVKDASKLFIALVRLDVKDIQKYYNVLIKILLSGLKKSCSEEDLALIDIFIQDIKYQGTKESHSSYRSLIELLIQKATTLTRLNKYFNVLSTHFTLKSVDDFEIIRTSVERFSSGPSDTILSLEDKCRFILHFSGQLEDPSEEIVQFYINILTECFAQNSWSIGLQLIADNCIDSPKIKRLIKDKFQDFLLAYINFNTSFNTASFKLVHKLVKEHFPHNIMMWKHLVFSLKEKYSQDIHDILIESIKELFHPQNIKDHVDKEVLIEIWYTLIILIKKCPSQRSLEYLNDHSIMIDVCSHLLQDAERKLEIYSFWKLWSDQINTLPLNDREDHVKALYEFSVSWSAENTKFLTEEKRLELFLTQLQFLLLYKIEEKFEDFSKRFKEHFEPVENETSKLPGQTALKLDNIDFKKIFLLLSTCELKGKDSEASEKNKTIVVDIRKTLLKLFKNVQLSKYQKLIAIPTVVQLDTQENNLIGLQKLLDYIQSDEKIPPEDLTLLKNYQVGPFLVLLSQKKYVREQPHLQNLITILVSRNITLLATAGELDTASSHIILHLQTTQTETKLRIELILKRPKAVFLLKEFSDFDHENILDEVVIDLIHLTSKTKTYEFLREMFIQANKIPNPKLPRTNIFLTIFLHGLSNWFLAFKKDDISQHEFAENVVDIANQCILECIKNNESYVIESLSKIKMWIIECTCLDLLSINKLLISLSKSLQTDQKNPEILSLSYHYELTRKSLTNQFNREFLQLFFASKQNELARDKLLAVEVLTYLFSLHNNIKASKIFDIENVSLVSINYLAEFDPNTTAKIVMRLFNPNNYHLAKDEYFDKLLIMTSQIIQSLKNSNAKPSYIFKILFDTFEMGMNCMTMVNCDVISKISYFHKQIENLKKAFPSMANYSPEDNSLVFKCIATNLRNLHLLTLKDLGFGLESYVPIVGEFNPIEQIATIYVILFRTFGDISLSLNSKACLELFSEYCDVVGSYFCHRNATPETEPDLLEFGHQLCFVWLKKHDAIPAKFTALIAKILSIPRHREYHEKLVRGLDSKL
jgi:hypothetical protein